MNQLHKDLIKVVEDIFNLTDDEHKEILKLYNDSRNNVNQFIANLYLNYANDGVLDYNDYLRNHAPMIETQLIEEARNIATIENTVMAVILHTVFESTYNKTAYTMDKHNDFKLFDNTRISAGVKFNLLRPEVIETVVKYNWSGIPFSERIWHNNEMLVRSLRQELAQGLQAGESIDKMAKRINKQFNSKAYQSQRLIRTESARIITDAQEQIYNDIGVEEVIWLATLEANTCSECGALDGKKFRLDDENKPRIPLHPNCRCAYAPVPFDGYEPTKRKDNETKGIIDFITFEEWARNKGI